MSEAHPATDQKLKVGDVYRRFDGKTWFVYGWPTNDLGFSTEQDAERAWSLACEHASDEKEKLADRIRDVIS